MPKSVLTRKRSMIARFAVLAMVFSLMAVALPASAHSVALSSTGPCPAATPSAGFTDIGGFDATTQTAINCLFAFGITTGTSATTYSPDGVVPRWQMALFLVRQAADHGLTIPAAVSQGYTDIGAFDTATQNAINQITQMGISKGTSTTTFSPDLGVSRWQMALFIHRTGVAAGVTFNNTEGHNDFTDIGGQLAEAQTSINALADTRADPEGHIALGTGGSLFSPDLPVLRWQMALFLTRLLAADNIAAPSGTLVVVTPSAQATQTTGTARAYSATVKNSDGTNYSGQVIIRLRDANSDGTLGTTAAVGALIDSVDGGGIAPVVSTTTFAGIDGLVNFTVRHSPATAAGDAVPQVIRDSNTNGTVDTGEIIGNGGAVFFTFVPAELAATAGPTAAFLVCSTDKADDFFVVDTSADNDCDDAAGVVQVLNRVEYDDNDLYIGDALNMTEFEDALSLRDTVSMAPYASTDASQSTFTLADDTALLTIDAVTSPKDADTQVLSGAGNPGWDVVVYRDQPTVGTYSTTLDPQLSAVAVVDPDGSWTAPAVPLSQGATNDFIVVQRTAGASVTSAPAGGSLVADDNVQGIQIVETALAGALITDADGTNGGIAARLDAGDVLVIVHSKTITPGSGVITMLDSGGTRVSVTCGSGGTTCTGGGTATITVTVGTVTVVTAGDNGLLDWTNATSTSIESYSGITDSDGLAPNVSGSGVNRLFDSTF